MTELGEGGYPVKNASYWRRESIKSELENADLRAQIKVLTKDVERLTKCLSKSNEYHEKFEREMYLERDRAEKAEQQVETLREAIENETIKPDYTNPEGIIRRLRQALKDTEGEE